MFFNVDIDNDNKYQYTKYRKEGDNIYIPNPEDGGDLTLKIGNISNFIDYVLDTASKLYSGDLKTSAINALENDPEHGKDSEWGREIDRQINAIKDGEISISPDMIQFSK